MYKNLNCDLLGISGRQSEIIELALTYGFQGIDVDISDMVKRSQRTSFENAARFITSAKLKVSGFDAPIDLDADDETYQAQAALLNGVAEVAGRVQAGTAILNIPDETDRLPYPEYFEVIRKRIDEIAATFGKEEVRSALAFTANPKEESVKEFKFVRDVEGFIALAKSCKDAGIVFDGWNWFVGGGSESQLETLGIDRVYSVRIGDCVEGVSAAQATADDCLLPMSTGVIDNQPYLEKFAKAELELPVAAVGRLPNGGTRDAVVSGTQDALNKSFEQAGLPIKTRKPEMFAETSYVAS